MSPLEKIDKATIINADLCFISGGYAIGTTPTLACVL